MIYLRTLGAVQLRGPQGDRLLALAAQPKRLALLAYLAVGNRGAPHRRDSLVALFWPELSAERARAALRKALHYLREGLGPDVIVTRGDEEVWISETALECDARRFQDAVRAGAIAEALELYGGDFLAGLHLTNAPEFDRWLDLERRRLSETAAASATSLAAAERTAGRLDPAIRWAQRAVAIAPLEERPVRLLLELLLESGDRSAALRAYERFARALAADLDVAPSDELRRLVQGVGSTGRVQRQESPPGAHAVPENAVTARPAKRLWWRLAATFGIVALGVLTAFTTWRDRRERWVIATAIPEMQRLLDAGDIESAHTLARRAAAALPGDSALHAAWSQIATRTVLRTSPAGARVYRAAYGDTTEWELIGTTPTDSVWLPGTGGQAWWPSLYRIEKPGFVTRYLVAAGFPRQGVQLDSLGAVDTAMVRVDAGAFDSRMPALEFSGELALDAFLMDRHEVSNRQYKAFVDAGGYERGEYWEEEFLLEGRRLTRDAALRRFVDRTGRPGPATWEGGAFPPEAGDLPVGGVSWYEARAYAKWSGKALPTVYHWAKAAGQPFAAFIVPRSNFESQGPRPVGRSSAISPFGTFDMAGNVREWCMNATGTERYLMGGGWNDPIYQFTDAHAQDPFDRSATNGMRLVRYLREDTSLALAMRPVDRTTRDFSAEQPVSAAVFEGIRGMYDYDQTPLNAVVESRDSTDDWVREKVTFDAAYGRERVPAFVYLPHRARPPYQVVVFFPGSGAQALRSTRTLANLWTVNFVVRSGRALVYPIYKDTYERRDSLVDDVADTTVKYRDKVLTWAKDLRRSLDYIATRGDMDTARVAYFGVSWGGYLGGIFPAVEPRLKTAVLLGVGLQMERARPEAEPLNFLPRIKVPVLMLTGKHDHFFPPETSQKPFYELLGTPAARKRHVVFEGGHLVPRTMYVREVLNWLDKYLGPVR